MKARELSDIFGILYSYILIYVQHILNHVVIEHVNTIPGISDIHIRDNQYTIWLSKSNVNNDL